MADPAVALQDQSPAHSLAFIDAGVETVAFGESMASARFQIVNLGTGADDLVEASSPDFETVRLHVPRSVPFVQKNRIAAPMIHVSPYGFIAVGSHGLKMLLIDPVRPLRAGSRLTLTLRFRNAGDITVNLPVLATGQRVQITGD
ncbi:copper chaperone PCu(A)C [Microvirga sp. VF16]|uniref:copper chaperone PCu(A)C n=1 Tax=Microvirga sp. VF16 TaxID=2807101 RepID=UPI00193EBBBE|nr:copper chaperone PCu(A)C [Microvirga sp. VF16]QRM35280.1 copper chaperone PCu(A)C [Microvirga sp. VF16]